MKNPRNVIWLCSRAPRKSNFWPHVIPSIIFQRKAGADAARRDAAFAAKMQRRRYRLKCAIERRRRASFVGTVSDLSRRQWVPTGPKGTAQPVKPIPAQRIVLVHWILAHWLKCEWAGFIVTSKVHRKWALDYCIVLYDESHRGGKILNKSTDLRSLISRDLQ